MANESDPRLSLHMKAENGFMKPLDLALVALLQPLGDIISTALCTYLQNARGLLVSSHISSNRLPDGMTASEPCSKP